MAERCCDSKQAQLIARLGWQRRRAELARVERRHLLVEAEAAARLGHALLDQLRERTMATLALEPAGIVILAVTHIAHERDHALGAVRELAFEPLAEQILDL